MPLIFLSYRAEDVPGHVGRLFNDLVDEFGPAQVILDTTVLLPDWRPPADLTRNFDVVLVVVGPKWRSTGHGSDLDNAEDIVRMEIATALKFGVPIIPVFVNGADHRLIQKLPFDIARISSHEGLVLDDSSWDEQMVRLVERLRRFDETPDIPTRQHDIGPPALTRQMERAPESVDSALPPATEGRDIFISYVEEDGAVAAELAQELRAQQQSTWTYEEDGVPGVSYLTQVFRAIDSCRAVVLIASANSVRARQVIKEIEAAHERDKMLIAVRVGMSHQELTAANEILRMAIGTAVTLPLDQRHVAGAAKRIASAIRASQMRK